MLLAHHCTAMKLQLTPNRLMIQLTPSERFWSFHWPEAIAIPRAHILQAHGTRPETGWQHELRAPGTWVPGVIKAGTYYTERGREFWYCLAPEKPVLTLDLAPAEYYKRIVLTLPEGCDVTADRF